MKKKSKLTPFVLLVPYITLLVFFLVGLTDGILQGFGYIPAFQMDRFTLEYFKLALADPNVLSGIGISLYVALVSASAAVVLAALLCFIQVTLKKEHGFLSAILRIPLYIPWVVTGFMMILLLSGGGWLARLFSTLGLDPLAQATANILHSPGQTGIIFAFIWASTPFACFLIQTVMSAVTDTLGEAAANLGAGLWHRFWNVTLPLCLPVIRSTFLIVLVSTFGCYEIPALLGMTLPRALPVEIFYHYSQFDPSHRPFAMALNTIMLIIVLTMVGGLHLLGRIGQKAGLKA